MTTQTPTVTYSKPHWSFKTLAIADQRSVFGSQIHESRPRPTLHAPNATTESSLPTPSPETETTSPPWEQGYFRLDMPLLNRWQPAQFAARQSATEPPVVGEGVSEVLDLYEATRFEDDGDALERATAKIEVLWAADNDPVEAVAIWLNDEHSARETTLMMMALGSVARAHADRSEAMELLLLRALQSERAQDRLAATFGAEASRWPRAIKALERAAQSEPIGYIAGLQKRIVELLGDGESRARLVSTQA